MSEASGSERSLAWLPREVRGEVEGPDVPVHDLDLAEEAAEEAGQAPVPAADEPGPL